MALVRTISGAVAGVAAHIWRRFIPFYLGVVMIERGRWLATDPFTQTAPTAAPVLFIAGGLVLLAVTASPHWRPWMTIAAGVAVSGPFLFFAWWTLTAYPWGRIQGTFWLLTVPPVMTLRWGKFPSSKPAR